MNFIVVPYSKLQVVLDSLNARLPFVEWKRSRSCADSSSVPCRSFRTTFIEIWLPRLALSISHSTALGRRPIRQILSHFRYLGCGYEAIWFYTVSRNYSRLRHGSSILIERTQGQHSSAISPLPHRRGSLVLLASEFVTMKLYPTFQPASLRSRWQLPSLKAGCLASGSEPNKHQSPYQNYSPVGI